MHLYSVKQILIYTSLILIRLHGFFADFEKKFN